MAGFRVIEAIFGQPMSPRLAQKNDYIFDGTMILAAATVEK